MAISDVIDVVVDDGTLTENDTEGETAIDDETSSETEATAPESDENSGSVPYEQST